MLRILLVYICLIALSLIKSIIPPKKKNVSLLCDMAKYYTIFYYFVCLARTLVGNGESYLSTSFADKGMVAYVKVGVLCLSILDSRKRDEDTTSLIAAIP